MKPSKPVLAVDIGGTKVLACVVAPGGRVLARRKTKTGDPNDLIERVETLGKEAVADAGLKLADLEAIGVAVPGGVDRRTGVVVRAVNLGWKDFPAGKLLSRAFGRPVIVENDANAGLLGEATYGSLKRWHDDTLTGFFVGTGVGGGLMMGGRLYRGVSGSAGELGHMVVAHGGPKCACGRRGCLESFAGRRSIEKRLRKAGVEPPGGGRFTGGKLRKALTAGDKSVRRELESAAEHLGVGVANLLAILNPRGFVLGGGVIEAVGDFLLPRILKSVEKNAFGKAYKDCHIVRSALGDEAVALGAAAFARGLG